MQNEQRNTLYQEMHRNIALEEDQFKDQGEDILELEQF
jgi:hypothetical protein